ncbi:hypothetical protein EYC80_003420 [Monilinia laxa]|uniref:Uncharacterized protein n=1 Tax=Monilinia laxa TaxID=61186 RepID=A0A5N6KDS3_MONLA|nr:hypothetical protein EYC80_003420 [Monilinia laxa]
MMVSTDGVKALPKWNEASMKTTDDAPIERKSSILKANAGRGFGVSRKRVERKVCDLALKGAHSNALSLMLMLKLDD